MHKNQYIWLVSLGLTNLQDLLNRMLEEYPEEAEHLEEAKDFVDKALYDVDERKLELLEHGSV